MFLLTYDNDLQGRLIHQYDLFLTPEGNKYIYDKANVDYRVTGDLHGQAPVRWNVMALIKFL